MFKFPVEIISDIYLSKIGGFSYELNRNEIGINAKALEQNTSIIANETYASIKMLESKPKPYFFRKKYLVIGIEKNMECYELTQNGEVVLPENLSDEYEKGKEVLINTVEFFRIDGDYSKIFRVLWRSGLRERRN